MESHLKGIPEPLADDLESLGLGKLPAGLEALLTVGVSINSLATSWCELGLWPLCGMKEGAPCRAWNRLLCSSEFYNRICLFPLAGSQTSQF